MNYSLDVIKKLAFEKEIETIDNGYRVELGSMPVEKVKEYLKQRIEEIEKEYGEPMARD